MKQFDSETEDIQMEEDYKPTYIKEQHNTNCQQFFGPISGCTFMMPATSPASRLKPKGGGQKSPGKEKPAAEKPMTLKYFKHGNNGVLKQQQQRVDIVFKKWNEWGWIDSSTSPDDFDSFFKGDPRHCNIKWTGSNSTVLTILLQKLLTEPYIEKLTGCSAKSLVKKQFGMTANYDQKRIDKADELRIRITLYILDIINPLPQRDGSDDNEYDTKDAAMQAILSGQLRNTKGI